MEDITQQKLQLVQQIRNQHYQNQYEMKDNVAIRNKNDTKITMEFLKLRCVFAAILFLFAIVFDLLEVTPCGASMEQIFYVIGEDYQENMTEFVEKMTLDSVLE